MALTTLQEQFGQIDIYLFDQLLKGRISPGMRILDTGCGSGRNLVYLLREGYDVYAADLDPQAVDSVRSLARRLAPALPGVWPRYGKNSEGAAFGFGQNGFDSTRANTRGHRRGTDNSANHAAHLPGSPRNTAHHARHLVSDLEN